MDNTLLSAFSKDSAENAAILTRNDDRVNVDVEDDIDAEFWGDLLRYLCPTKDFHFVPYHTNLKADGDKVFVRGKSHVLHPDEDFNKWHIGCVDSDYDWLLSDYTADGRTICNNKYLLQTYAYSIENLMCLSSTLKDLCHDVTEEPVDFDFEDYLSKLSEIVYPLLVRSAYLYKENNVAFSPKDWRHILVNTEKNADTSLEQIKHNTEQTIKELDKVFDFKNRDFDEFQKSISSEKDVSEGTAYLYVRGHELFDHLKDSILNPLIINLRNRHREALRETCRDDVHYTAALQDYQKNVKSLKELLQNNFRYKRNTPLYDKIKNDVLQIWE